jgi:hypothetical protein
VRFCFFKSTCTKSQWRSIYDGTFVAHNLVVLSELHEPLRSDALRALEREAEGPIPEKLGEGTVRTRDTEEHRVVLALCEAVFPEKNAGVGVNVRVPGILFIRIKVSLNHNL